MKYIKSALLLVLVAGMFTSGSMRYDRVQAQPVQQPVVQKQQVQQAIKAAPLAIVDNPKSYLNKTVLINAKFDKFSTLGLDYKPAFKSSEDYISFLIRRDDTGFNIPLSEMKLFLKRTEAEKFIDLKTNDEIEIKGVVFSDALGDAWIDVQEMKITKKAPEEDKK